VTGRLTEMVDEVFSTCEGDSVNLSLPACLRPPTDAELNVVMEDFKRGKSVIIALVTMKTDYMQRLPTLFAGLAVVDEELARSVAVRIKDAWPKDPRKVAHHRVTWSLMGDSSSFSSELLGRLYFQRYNARLPPSDFHHQWKPRLRANTHTWHSRAPPSASGQCASAWPTA